LYFLFCNQIKSVWFDLDLAIDMEGGDNFLPDDNVREYIRKRKRKNQSVSVTHLRKVLNIGYKKAKRIYDEFESEKPASKPRSKSKAKADQKREEVEDSSDGVQEETESSEDDGAEGARPVTYQNAETDEEEENGDLDSFTLSNCLLKAAHFAATKHRLQKRKDDDGI